LSIEIHRKISHSREARATKSDEVLRVNKKIDATAQGGTDSRSTLGVWQKEASTDRWLFEANESLTSQEGASSLEDLKSSQRVKGKKQLDSKRPHRSNYDPKLSPTGERGITKSATKNLGLRPPQAA